MTKIIIDNRSKVSDLQAAEFAIRSYERCENEDKNVDAIVSNPHWGLSVYCKLLKSGTKKIVINDF